MTVDYHESLERSMHQNLTQTISWRSTLAISSTEQPCEERSQRALCGTSPLLAGSHLLVESYTID